MNDENGTLTNIILRTVFAGYSIPANTVRNITLVKVPFSSFMDERNEDVLGTQS